MSNNLLQKTEQQLQVLVGKPLWAIGRAYVIWWFHFGSARTVPSNRGGTRTVGEVALHVQCPWRIVCPDSVVVGFADREFPAGADPYTDPPNFDWHIQGVNRCDERIAMILGLRVDNPFVVQEIRVGMAGSFGICLTDHYALEVFPDHSLEDEYWRLFRPGVEDSHFVVTGNGIEDDIDEPQKLG
ncbi:MAG: hypothetical protein NVS2B7_16420 [Herpetosiphon sp.]